MEKNESDGSGVCQEILARVFIVSVFRDTRPAPFLYGIRQRRPVFFIVRIYGRRDDYHRPVGFGRSGDDSVPPVYDAERARFGMTAGKTAKKRLKTLPICATVMPANRGSLSASDLQVLGKYSLLFQSFHFTSWRKNPWRIKTKK